MNVKRWQQTVVYLAAGLAWNARADTNYVASLTNPYTPIVMRNIFNLMPPVGAVIPPPGNLPPKITPNGIMSILGHLQVLFQVSHTGQSAGKDSYILDEGQQQDDIEVVHIDALSGLITFNNHGVRQQIPLAGTPAVTPPLPPVDGSAMNSNPRPASFELSRTPDYLGGGPNAAPDDAPLQNTSLEQRIVMIEAQRAYLKSQNDPAADLLPPTAMTPAD